MPDDAAVSEFLAVARATVGGSEVLTDPDLIAGYSVDWTRRWRGAAAAVVRPTTTEQVAALVAAARAKAWRWSRRAGTRDWWAGPCPGRVKWC